LKNPEKMSVCDYVFGWVIRFKRAEINERTLECNHPVRTNAFGSRNHVANMLQTHREKAVFGCK